MRRSRRARLIILQLLDDDWRQRQRDFVQRCGFGAQSRGQIELQVIEHAADFLTAALLYPDRCPDQKNSAKIASDNVARK